MQSVETDRQNAEPGAPARSSRATREDDGIGDEIQHYAKDKARQARGQVRDLADAGREELASQLEGMGRALSRAGDELVDDAQDTAGDYTRMLGERAEGASRYVRERDAAALLDSSERFARREPWLFLGGCSVARLECDVPVSSLRDPLADPSRV